MGKSLALWFVYSLVVGGFAGYVAGRALPPGAEYLDVFRFAGTTAFIGYAVALWQNSIWYNRKWSTTLKNTFDGADSTTITVLNSGDHGDALDDVDTPASYSTAWAASGSASALLGDGDNAGGLWFAFDTLPEWSIRVYLNIPSNGFSWGAFTAVLWEFDDEFSIYTLGQEDVSGDAAHLIGQPIRLLIAHDGSATTYRMWWTDPHSTGSPDHEHTDLGGLGLFDYFNIVGGYGAPSHVD
jgi:hypothetical protein